jgi:hypothetical protein
MIAKIFEFTSANNRKDFGPFVSRMAHWGKDSDADDDTVAGKRKQPTGSVRKVS